MCCEFLLPKTISPSYTVRICVDFVTRANVITMRNHLFLVVILCQLLIWTGSQQNQQCDRIDNDETALSKLNNDFENGFLCTWIDESKSEVRWKIEKFDSPWEPNCKAPVPVSGSSYLRVDRGSNLSFGVTVLRSLTFTLPSDDYGISFTFWIRSKWPQFTNLELYLAENGKETLLTSLYRYSNSTNQQWQQTETIRLKPKSFSSKFSLVFYAYCGADVEDAVAIDNIYLIFQPSTPAFTEMPTTIDTTDTRPTTTETSPTTSKTTTTTTKTTPTTSKTTTTTTKTTPTTSKTTITIKTTPTTFKTTTRPSGTVSTTKTSTTLINSCSSATISFKDLPNIKASFNCPNSSDLYYPAHPEDSCSKEYYECKDCRATLRECQNNKVFFNYDCRSCASVEQCKGKCKDNKNHTFLTD